mgnify:CR=1 FL=1
MGHSIDDIGTDAFSWGAVLNSSEADNDGTVTVATTDIEDGQQLTITLNGATYTSIISNNSTTVTITAADLQALTDGQSYTLTADVSNASGYAATQVTSSSFAVDKTAPTFKASSTISVSSNNSNNSVYVKQGDIITFTALFSEAVSINTSTAADMRIPFQIGSNTYYADATTALSSLVNSSDTMTFTYTVPSSVNGAVSFAQSATLDFQNSATLKDTAGNDMTSTTLPSLSGNVTVDNIAPTMTITATEVSNGDTSNDATISLTFTSSGGISNFVQSDITLGNGTLSNFIAVYSTVYTATFTPLDEGACTIGVAAGAYTDAAGNNNVATQFNWTFDTTAPTLTLNSVSIASNNATSTLAKVGDVITLSMTASEPISTPVVIFQSGGAAITDISITYVNTSGNTWTAAYTANSSDTNGPVSYSIAFSDSAGNAGTDVTSGSGSVTFDKTAPTLSTVSIASNNTTPTLAEVGDVITLSMTASEPISTPVVTFQCGGDAITDTSITYVNTSGNTWTAAYTAAVEDTDGVVSYSIAFSDLASNAGTAVVATTDSTAITFDTAAPTISSIAVASNNATTTKAKAGDIITFKVAFSEAVTLSTASDVKVPFKIGETSTLAIAQSATTATIGGIENAINFTYTVQAGLTGSVALVAGPLTLANSATVLDAAGNALTGNMSVLIDAVAVDTTAPSAPTMATITTPTNDTTPTITGAGVNGDTITLYEGSNSLGTVVVSSSAWSITPSAMSAGTYTITATATDPVGNVSAASTSQTLVIDTTAPTVSSFVLADTTLTRGETSMVTLTFSEAVIGFSSADDITVQNGTLSIMNTVDNIIWTGTFTPTADITDTTNILTLGTAYTDSAGNTGVGNTTANYSVDTIAPTITLNTASFNFVVGVMQLITATSSEELYYNSNLLSSSNKPATNITVTTSSSGTAANVVIVSPTVFTFEFTPAVVSDTLTITVANTITDIAGNVIANTDFPITASTIARSSACFPSGTPINTDQGIVAIDKINIATHTIRGNKIKTITQTYLVGNKMVLFKKNSLHNNVPCMDTIMSRHHQVYYNKEMTEAYKFIKLNKAEHIEFPEDTVIYNVLLDNHEKMVINNMIVETQDPHSTTGYFYNNFILNENCSNKDIRYASELLTLFNTEKWTKAQLDLNTNNLVGKSVLHIMKEGFKSYLVQHKNKNKKRVHKIMDKLIPVHK